VAALAAGHSKEDIYDMPAQQVELIAIYKLTHRGLL
jgi:hypothetical protein